MKRIALIVFFIFQMIAFSASAVITMPSHLAVPAATVAPNPITVQELNDQLAKAERENAFYNAKIEQLQDQVAQLQQQLDAVNASQWTFALPDFVQPLENLLITNRVVSIVAGTTAVLIILLWLPWKRRKPKERAEPIMPLVATDPDLKDEYDYMSTEEAIPAKLDLARAYIDMDEFDSAIGALNEVIKKGNDAQKQQARNLLATLPATQ